MPKKKAFLIAFFCFVYVAARVWRLTDSCLWFDEIFSIHAAEHPWAEIIPFVAKDLIHPPLSYILLKLWIAAAGESLLWLRLFPVFFSVLALFPLWMLCRELKLEKTTITVAFGLFAVNGALIKYAQEVRMYSPLFFFSLMSMWLFSRYYFRGKSFWILVIVNILLVYTHYFGWFVIAAEVLTILIGQRIKVLRTLLMLAVTAAAFVPWVVALLRFAEPGSSVQQNIGWMQRPGIRSVFELFFDLVDPFYFQQSSADAGAFYPVAVPVLLIVLGSTVFYLVRLGGNENKERVFFLSTFAVIPIVSVFLLSWVLPVSLWGSRHLLIIFPSALLLVSICLTEIKPEILKYCVLGAVTVLAAAALVLHIWREQTRFTWCAWNDVATAFVSRPNPAADEKLYAFEELAAYHLWFSMRNVNKAKIVLVKGTGVSEDTAFFLPRGFDEVKIINERQIAGEQLLIAFRAKQIDFGKAPVSTFMAQGYEIEEIMRFPADDSVVYLIRLRKR